MDKKKIVYEDKFTCECGCYEVDFTRLMYSVNYTKSIICPNCNMKYCRVKNEEPETYKININNDNKLSAITTSLNNNINIIDVFSSDITVEEDGIYKYERIDNNNAKKTLIISREAFVEAFAKYIDK